MRSSASWMAVPEISTDRLPFSAKNWDMGQQIGADLAYLGCVEPVAFTQVRRAAWTVETESESRRGATNETCLFKRHRHCANDATLMIGAQFAIFIIVGKYYRTLHAGVGLSFPGAS